MRAVRCKGDTDMRTDTRYRLELRAPTGEWKAVDVYPSMTVATIRGLTHWTGLAFRVVPVTGAGVTVETGADQEGS